MKEIKIDELKRIQMDVFQSIHEFCVANNIKYSMGCGTMLGAIRHQGYIPWDDDMDMYMLREDYNKLMKTFPHRNNNAIMIASRERDCDWERPYAKAYNSNTSFSEPGECLNIGVNIDIFPIDKVPFEEDNWLQFNKRRLLIDRLRYLRLHPIKDVSLKSFWLRIPLCLFSRKFWQDLFDSYIQKYNSSDSPVVFETSLGLIQKHHFPISVFDDIVEYPFEDRSFCGFKDYDTYLKNGFGDYMTLPPVEKRKSHHEFTAYWK